MTKYALIILLFANSFLFSEYPLIETMNGRDVVFKQLQDDIASFYKQDACMEKLPDLTIYRYKIEQNDNIFSISARVNIPYDTIATLNNLENPGSITSKNEILIPGIPGIFVALHPSNELEFLMISWRPSSKFEYEKEEIEVNQYGKTNKYLFIPDSKFTATERAFFLGIFFKHPLPKSRLTSYFGYRSDPFSGKCSFHRGIDLAAPRGTSVLASRSGNVIEKAKNPVLGNYIVIQHGNGYQTVYGHLESYNVDLGDHVASGSVIGTVGSTGKSTGPHLHFEIRKNGKAEDPLPHLSGY